MNLAAELGLDENSVDFTKITSGQQDGRTIEALISTFRFLPWGGGWRVMVVEEADMITPQAAKLWLSFVRSPEAHSIFERYGFKPFTAAAPAN